LDNAVLLWQVSCEYVAASKRLEPFGFDAALALRHIAALKTVRTRALPTWKVQELAEGLTISHSLSWSDALLIAACLEAGVDRLYTEDLDSGARYEGVEIVNPFL